MNRMKRDKKSKMPDEVSRRKGQVYLTVVYDLERRVLLWVGGDRTEEAVRPFFTQEMASGAAARCAWFAWHVGALRQTGARSRSQRTDPVRSVPHRQAF